MYQIFGYKWPESVFNKTGVLIQESLFAGDGAAFPIDNTDGAT